MWGSIIGDLAGSIYEYDQINKVKEVLSRFTLQEIETVTKESFNYSDANTVFSTINSFIK